MERNSTLPLPPSRGRALVIPCPHSRLRSLTRVHEPLACVLPRDLQHSHTMHARVQGIIYGAKTSAGARALAADDAAYVQEEQGAGARGQGVRNCEHTCKPHVTSHVAHHTSQDTQTLTVLTSGADPSWQLRRAPTARCGAWRCRSTAGKGLRDDAGIM